MKFFSILFCSLCFLAVNLAAEVELTFENPDNYRDIDYEYAGNKRGQKLYLPQFEKHINKQAERYLEEGQVLSMVITDIDLAGDYEPWRSADAMDIRIVKSIYPPRIKFSYELKDADGNVLESGDEHLSDLSFNYKIRINYNDELFYDKELITDWFRKLNKKSK
ncbi:MAG: DUF3016 domain-containing protein [Verrucomicrobia bacterium]|nr:DUF3016 domain-containing protein [Verrucomicrobiota bacterium]MDA1067813.1 DUF3016 domain-containing protein [Verrucomicrobiota bacterium]